MRGVEERNFLLKYKLGIVIFLLILDIFGLFFLRRYVDLSFFADLMNAIISLAVAGLILTCYYRSEKSEKKFIIFLFIAFAFRFLGEALWMYYDLAGTIMPAFSFADLAWVFSNLTIILAFEYKLYKSNIQKNKMLIFFIVVLFLLSAAFLIGIYLKLIVIDQSLWLSYLVNESYVLFDLFILILLLTPLYFSIEKLKQSFLFYFFLSLGFVTTIIYDYLFAEFYLAGTYYSGGKLEILYFFSYVLWYAAFYFRYSGFCKG